MDYFVSDWHLGHKNIIRFDDRKISENKNFKDLDHHDNFIIDTHNEVVGPGDNFYYLGDFALTDTKKAEAYLQRMSGNKFFISGNHDHHAQIKLYEKYGMYLGEQKKIISNGQDIVLNHFPMRSWNRSHHGSWHLYGHEHGMLEHITWGKSMDVCLILNDYKPFSFPQIKSVLDKRETLLQGHHDGTR